MQTKDANNGIPLGEGRVSRENILANIKNNQPSLIALPEVENFQQPFTDVVERYKTILQSIGGSVYEVKNIAAVIDTLKVQFIDTSRIISVLPELSPYATFYQQGDDPHLLNDVDIAIIPAHFGVAENGSVWVTEAILQERVLPFICQHLVAIIDTKNIIATMHEAYDKIAGTTYAF
ncbi:LUD domain-containing protein, partial [Ferruginibacter sp.]|uniref:LutC/YkgG family protein n=1 Tax=Ferruginibacter sp. TaxID=1940288 RepID=UPI0026583479